MQELLEQRLASRALDGRYTELRQDRQSGEKKFKCHGEVDTDKFVDKEQRTFNDRYEEGTSMSYGLSQTRGA